MTISGYLTSHLLIEINYNNFEKNNKKLLDKIWIGTSLTLYFGRQMWYEINYIVLLTCMFANYSNTEIGDILV